MIRLFINQIRSISFSLPKHAFKQYKCTGPDLTFTTTKEELSEAYYKMNLIRRMEIAADSLYKARLVRGFLHLYIGQEAVAVGITQQASKDDAIITAYRCHAFALMRGNTPESILAELLGRASGSSKGKGGSMHIFGDKFYGGNGIVGAEVPIGTGLALAQKYLNEPNVSYILYGDGAANQGQVFESFNMAKLWNLPCIYICENNKYGMGTSAERSSASTEYYKRGQFIPGLWVDGMDLLAVRKAIEWARSFTLENGPIVLEMDTYRYQGHSMSDPGTTYRTRQEIQQIRQTRDPIGRFKDLVIERKVLDEQELKDIEKLARETIADALQKSKDALFPSDDSLTEDIYSE